MKMPERNVRPSVYLAIPNNGWWRSELSYGLIQMIGSSKLKFVVEDPQITRGMPLGNVRCKIVKRFLRTSCRVLVMIDNDEAPFSDLSEIIEAMGDEMDIVGCPSLTKQDGLLKWHAWSAYEEKDGKQGYKSVNLDALIDPPDFLSVDVIGGGCMIIKRRVLEDERMKAPFIEVIDKDTGEIVLTEDFDFCIKAKEAGYKIFTTPKKRCEHFKCVGILGHQDTVKRTNDLSTTEAIIR